LKKRLKIFIISGLILSTAINGFPSDLERMWYVRNESRLAISGESNVNDFKCEVDRYYRADNLLLYSSPGPHYQFSDNQMVINLMEFDCGRKLITRDFRQTLNADKDPQMVISFLSLDRLPNESTNIEQIRGRLHITIAGVSKETQIQLSINNMGNGTIHLHGNHDFSFTDFGIEPPSKALGLINVKNELEVTFDLILEDMAAGVSGKLHKGH
jgi:hypothetical protein